MDTPQGFNCFEFIFDNIEIMQGPLVVVPPGPLVEFLPDEDEVEEEEVPLLAWPEEPLLLEWHGVVK